MQAAQCFLILMYGRSNRVGTVDVAVPLDDTAAAFASHADATWSATRASACWRLVRLACAAAVLAYRIE